MILLTPSEEAALRALLDAAGDVPHVLIGARAVACHVSLSWRSTDDLDLVVGLSFDDIGSLMGGLQGWRQAEAAHRWLSPSNQRLDVLPATPEVLRSGFAALPSGRNLSLLGMRLALERAMPLELAPGLRVNVAPPEVLLLLKMSSYLDLPGERVRDLGDLAHLIEEWPPRDADERFTTDVDYDLVGAHLLGTRLRGCSRPDEVATVRSFLGRLNDERDPLATQSRMLRQAPRAWNDDPEQLLRRWRAFGEALGAG